MIIIIIIITTTFQEPLNKDNSASIHYRNLQVLAREMFKIHRGLSPEILRETNICVQNMFL